MTVRPSVSVKLCLRKKKMDILLVTFDKWTSQSQNRSFQINVVDFFSSLSDYGLEKNAARKYAVEMKELPSNILWLNLFHSNLVFFILKMNLSTSKSFLFNIQKTFRNVLLVFTCFFNWKNFIANKRKLNFFFS